VILSAKNILWRHPGGISCAQYISGSFYVEVLENGQLCPFSPAQRFFFQGLVNLFAILYKITVRLSMLMEEQPYRLRGCLFGLFSAFQ
jgi:hypothetical protein